MTSRRRLLDLFCGAGGAAMGYSRAGFDVVGVDVKPQPNYPFEFVQADALGFLADDPPLVALYGPFDAIHASPPCQLFSSITRVRGNPADHPDLITPLRPLLIDSALPYVIENVQRAAAFMVDPALICGVALGLRLDQYVLRRHRLFETNFPLMTPGCGCHRGDGKTLGVYGGGTTQKSRRPPEGWDTSTGGRPDKANREQGRKIMGIPWMLRTELAQAIPPAYTELIGAQLLQHLEAKAAA